MEFLTNRSHLYEDIDSIPIKNSSLCESIVDLPSGVHTANGNIAGTRIAIQIGHANGTDKAFHVENGDNSGVVSLYDIVPL
jgi:hypothetical protein